MLKEHSFDTGEVELNYLKSPDNGPPIVLLHGLTGLWIDFAPIIPYLLLRHTVYAMNLRGHGKSGRVSGRYRCLDYGQDIRSFIEGRLGEPAIVHGFSTGGLVGAYLAAQHPELLSALILDEPAIFDTTHLEWVYDYFSQCYEYTSTGKTEAELREILGVDNAWARHRAWRLSQLDPGPLAAWFDRSHWEGFEPETMLKEISCPTLLIHANPEIDWGSALTKEEAEFTLSAIPDCVSEYWDDVGHITHQNHPVRFMAVAARFLESL